MGPAALACPNRSAGCDEEGACTPFPARFLRPAASEEEVFDVAVLVNAPVLLVEDPYASAPTAAPDSSAVCGLLGAESGYTLQSFEGQQATADSGARVTHGGACGQCSGLQNLAVYMRHSDLTDPVRECGITGMFEGDEANIACLEAIGFDSACAQVWFFNTRHTREVCLDVCLANLDSPHHNPDGSLNECLVCDEEESGPVFKAFAGRPRRNLGLPSGLCRPCDSVTSVVHRYF